MSKYQRTIHHHPRLIRRRQVAVRNRREAWIHYLMTHAVVWDGKQYQHAVRGYLMGYPVLIPVSVYQSLQRKGDLADFVPTQAASRLEATIRFQLDTPEAQAGLLFRLAAQQYRSVVTHERLSLRCEEREVDAWPLALLLDTAYWMRVSIDAPLITLHVWRHDAPGSERCMVLYHVQEAALR